MDNIFSGKEARDIVSSYSESLTLPKLSKPIEVQAVLDAVSDADKVSSLDPSAIAEHALTLQMYASYMATELGNNRQRMNYIELQFRALMGEFLKEFPELQTVYRATVEDLLIAHNDKAKELYKQKVETQLKIDTVNGWSETLRNIATSLDKVTYARRQQNKSY